MPVMTRLPGLARQATSRQHRSDGGRGRSGTGIQLSKLVVSSTWMAPLSQEVRPCLPRNQSCQNTVKRLYRLCFHADP